MRHTRLLLDYVAFQEEAVLTYHASDMKLAAHSDASYLSEPRARSRAGGHFFLSNNEEIPPKYTEIDSIDIGENINNLVPDNELPPY